MDLPAPNLDVEENISNASSLLLFVPIERAHLQDAIQIINESKQFNGHILEYLDKTTPTAQIGNNYHIILVFGSQSTGKSTLLNTLFHTNFDVMDETRRQQTTKGIWMAHSPSISNTKQMGARPNDIQNILVMDVEGTDGRERGEDQDFERKAALFAMSTSEILIVNIWETQIGLYQGANMGLLKTVFEVNLSLFGKAKLHHNDHKVLLLFVIRDHIGVTPKENLAATLTQDMVAMWDSLSKPADVAHLQFADFFDIDFHTLGHKVLQPEKFVDDVKLLGDRIVDAGDDEYLFKPNYHHNIPIDGWTMYAESCWDQIDNNKDLDLPTQQILVAKFKCDEIAGGVYDEFLAKYTELMLSKVPTEKATDTIDYEELGRSFLDLRADLVENYDISASRYNKSVYEQKKAGLVTKINDKFKELFEIYANFLLASHLKQFSVALSTGRKNLKGTFHETVEALTKQVQSEFGTKIGFLSLDGDLSSVSQDENLAAELKALVGKQQVLELNNIVNKGVKKLRTGLSKAIVAELAGPSDSTWTNVLLKFKALETETLARFESGDTHDFGLGTSEEYNRITVQSLKFRSWEAFHDLVHKHISKDNLLNMLQERFDDKFRYDENGLPRLYQNALELEGSFNESKIHALKVLPVLTMATLEDGSEVVPEFDIFDPQLKRQYGGSSLALEEHAEEDFEEEDEEETPCFAEILSETDKAAVLSKFKREMDAKFVETKRLIIQHVTQIPYYIYLVIVVLGWNEFMAIIRNPFFFSLLLLLGAGVYVMYTLNLLKPTMVVAQRLVDEGVAVGKQRLKEFLVDDHETHAHNLGRISGQRRAEEKPEEIELDDLTPE